MKAIICAALHSKGRSGADRFALTRPTTGKYKYEFLGVTQRLPIQRIEHHPFEYQGKIFPPIQRIEHHFEYQGKIFPLLAVADAYYSAGRCIARRDNIEATLFTGKGIHLHMIFDGWVPATQVCEVLPTTEMICGGMVREFQFVRFLGDKPKVNNGVASWDAAEWNDDVIVEEAVVAKPTFSSGFCPKCHFDHDADVGCIIT